VRPTRATPWWDLTDEKLLDLRFCDLGLRIEGTLLDQRIRRIHDELNRRGLRFRPHVWLAEEWFSPDGIPGIAIPFYLAHPRLARLERKLMLEVEGGTEDWCMRILRHETGHAFDTAYGLHRRRGWRETFGPFSQKYPDFYQPKPYSKSFVLHLDLWYAQAHPAEDFAETFAVWLRPRSNWRVRYRGWPALKKLEYVDRTMREIERMKPVNASRAQIEPLRVVRKTLRQHYDEKRARYGDDYPDFYDRDLRRLFTDAPGNTHRPTAASFLRRVKPELRQVVAHWTGQYRYMIDQVLTEMIRRCGELRLRLARSERETKRDAIVMLTVQTMNYLHGGRHRLIL